MENVEIIRHPPIKIGHQADPSDELWAIGDVHGRADVLEALLAEIEATPRVPGRKRVVVQTGDLIDRGPQSLRAIDLCIRDDLVGLQGNHEQMALLARANRDHWFLGWSREDGLATLREGLGYSWDHDRSPDRIEVAFGPARWRWLKGLRTSYRSGDVLLVHAGVHPWGDLDKQLSASWDDTGDWSPFWIRGAFLSRWGAEPREVFVAHGHTPHDNEYRSGNECAGQRVNLDLGSWATGGVRAARFIDDVVEIVDAWGKGDSIAAREYRRGRIW